MINSEMLLEANETPFKNISSLIVCGTKSPLLISSVWEDGNFILDPFCRQELGGGHSWALRVFMPSSDMTA